MDLSVRWFGGSRILLETRYSCLILSWLKDTVGWEVGMQVVSVVMATTMACESTANLVGARDFLNRFWFHAKVWDQLQLGFVGTPIIMLFHRIIICKPTKVDNFFWNHFSPYLSCIVVSTHWEIFISLFIIRVNISPYKMTGPWEFEKKKAASARQRCANISSPFWGTKNLGKGEELKPKTCWFGWGLVSLFRWLTWLGFWEVAFFWCPKKPSVVINARRKRITA